DTALDADTRGHAVRDRRDRLRRLHLRPGFWLLFEGQRGVSGRSCPVGSKGNQITLKMNGHSIFICWRFSRDKKGASRFRFLLTLGSWLMWLPARRANST